MKILVTGAAGFINGYLVPDLLEAGHEVIGLDDFSKYGRLAKSYDDNPRYRFVEGDAKDVGLMRELAAGCDQVVAAAAMIGGISYFHEFAYDLLAENERILASTFDAAIAPIETGIWSGSRHQLVDGLRVGDRLPDARRRSADLAAADLDLRLPEARLGVLRQGRLEQYELPYTIVRPFNCVGIGERRALRDTDIMSGNVKLALSHVVPDLVLKVLKGQDPLHILGDGSQVRHYTYGGDLAHGIRLAMESPGGDQQRLQPLDRRARRPSSSSPSASGEGPRRRPAVPLRLRPAVRARRPAPVPDVRKAKEVLGFEATTSLETMLDEVIPWIRLEVEAGRL